MAALLAVFAEFEREILRKRVRAGLAHARQNGKRLGRPVTAGLEADKARKLYLAGVSKAEPAACRLAAPPFAGFWPDLFPIEIGFGARVVGSKGI
ncbi:hypothetical protein SBA3_1820006 [Candidatus Sulfopaludibacter sp. SbA3]|nr:hypothetical protein SBA3_1820006 [Candidatus Sulfopaludibacter sp. SbA3]